jgi:hypothetical protein
VSATFTLDVDDSSSLRWGVTYPVQQLSSAESRLAISLGGTLPPWLEQVTTRIMQLAVLPTVDPRGSRPFNVADVADALVFMSRVMRDDTRVPWIGRLASGGVQLTWHADDVEVEAVFDRARDDRELMVTVGENEWDAPIGRGETLFASVVDRLSDAQLEQAPA